MRKTFSVSVSRYAEVVIDVRRSRASATVDGVEIHYLSHLQALSLLTELSEAITRARAQLGKKTEVEL